MTDKMTQQFAKSHGNVKEADKEASSELIKRVPVKDSPFEVITINGESFIGMGNYRISEFYKTEEAAEESITKLTWNNICIVMNVMIDQFEKRKNLTN